MLDARTIAYVSSDQQVADLAQNPLTVRELRALRLLSDGASERDLMRELDLTLPATKHVKASIRSKLYARSTAQAVYRAWHMGLIP